MAAAVAAVPAAIAFVVCTAAFEMAPICRVAWLMAFFKVASTCPPIFMAIFISLLLAIVPGHLLRDV